MRNSRGSVIGVVFALAMLAVSCESPSKVWLHRANDIAKARYYQDQYSGLEVDVHFVDSLNTFIVKHGFSEVSDTRLEDWFASIERRRRLGFWIDFKNLDEHNAEPSAIELARLRRKFGLRKTIIVESAHPECLQAFKDRGFRISYYIPFEVPEWLNHEQLQKLTDSIGDYVKMYDLKTISGYWFQYQFMKDSFPEMRKLIWYELYDTAVRNHYINLAIEDDNTDVILVAVEDTIDYARELLRNQ